MTFRWFLAVLLVCAVAFVLYRTHPLQHGAATSSTADSTSSTAPNGATAAIGSPPLPAALVPPPPPPTAVEALHATLAACHPRLSRSLPVPQFDVSSIDRPELQHVKLNIRVNDDGSVSDASIAAFTFGLPSEHAAVLDYARNLVFAVSASQDCSGRTFEILADVFEAKDGFGHWRTLARLYPRYSLDRQGHVETRD